jgi:hypothetical protein
MPINNYTDSDIDISNLEKAHRFCLKKLFSHLQQAQARNPP